MFGFKFFLFFILSFFSAIFSTILSNSEWDLTSYNNLIESSNKMETIFDYTIVADTLDIRDNAMALGNVFASFFELGSYAKIYGNVDASNKCFLREYSFIQKDLYYTNVCTEQNHIFAKNKIQKETSKPSFELPQILVGTTPISFNSELKLQPGSYGIFYAQPNTKIQFSAGVYNFENFITEPNAELSFDLNEGTITINILRDVRFGDRNKMIITNGNPSEIIWNIAGTSIDFGTDGLYFGNFRAPQAQVRIPSRTHLVGGLYAHKLTIEPQSTISQEARVQEINLSEEHFAPFFEPGIFRYRSTIARTTPTIEFFVYDDSAKIKINNSETNFITLNSQKTLSRISVSKQQIPGFPPEAFRSEYYFEFLKSENYRVYWNPQTACKENCSGNSPETAIGNFSKALEIALETGREINMTGGIWNANEDFPEGIIPWKTGFEIKGYDGSIWDLNSERALPTIDLGNKSHIAIAGRAPRSLQGFKIRNGFNKNNGGALFAQNEKLKLQTIIFENNESNANGGALYFDGDSLNIQDVRFSENSSANNGGAIVSNAETNFLNGIFENNSAKNFGGAYHAFHQKHDFKNIIFVKNSAQENGGALFNETGFLNIWNCTFFNNTSKNYGAIAGNAKGNIGNSIFWKNSTNEIIEGFYATHSSFSKTYAGTSNHAGDPLFANEENPAGENKYMTYDAGINLSANSPLLNNALSNENAPEKDILGELKNNVSALGVYAFAKPNSNTAFGILNTAGEVQKTKPSIPLISAISQSYHREYLAKSPYARVFRIEVKKHKKTNKKKGSVKLWVKNANGEIYKDISPIQFEVYQNGESNGNYIFQTQTLTEGKPILFSKRPQDAGNFEEAIVIHMKHVSDYFYYEAE